MEQPNVKRTAGGTRLLLRGESAVAFIGVALAGILLIAVAAGVWWTLRTEQRRAEDHRVQQVRMVAELLTQTAESLIQADELSAVRRVVIDAAQTYQLERCRIILPDGQIAADSDPSQITLQKLPARWTGQVRDQTIQTQQSADVFKRVHASFPLQITGRGAATLEVTATIEYPMWLYSEAPTGLAAIGAVALIAVLMVYRHTRSRLRALGAIRESLLAMDRGENDETALALSPQFGHEADAWNRLLENRQQLHRQSVMEKARQSLGGQRGVDLHGACDALSQGMILIDNQLLVRYANGAAAVFLQAKRDQLVGGTVSEFLHEEQVMQAVQEAASAQTRSRSVIEIDRHPDGDGRGVLRFAIRPIRRGDSAAALIIIDDVTQQRVADEARNQFVAQATHELRTPLTNIRLYVETALEEGEQDAAMRAKCLNVINQESSRLERIVADMLSVAEIEAGALKLNADDVHMDVVLAELQTDYVRQAEDKGVVLSFNLPPKMPIIQADRDKLVLALHNLVGNALKYTESGGRVAVNVDVSEGQFLFEVRDTGFGIAHDDLDRIFEKFYRAKDRRVEAITGTGQGLALSREVIRLHGGDVTVESELDKGSTFTLTVPTRLDVA